MLEGLKCIDQGQFLFKNDAQSGKNPIDLFRTWKIPLMLQLND